MIEILQYVAVGAGLGFIVGHLLGKWSEAHYWRTKSDDSQGSRTAVCSHGKFFYVLPAHEYDEKILRLRKDRFGNWKLPEELN